MERDLESMLGKVTNVHHSRSKVDEGERPKKKRWVAFFDDQAEARKIWHVTNRKAYSATQPGWGIRKIIDLFHDLPNLLYKANKHAEIEDLEPDELEERNRSDFLGMTQYQIDDERKEYVIHQICDPTWLT